MVTFPEKELTRAYLIYPHSAPYRLQNQREIARFIEESAKVAPAEFYSGATPVGPLRLSVGPIPGLTTPTVTALR